MPSEPINDGVIAGAVGTVGYGAYYGGYGYPAYSYSAPSAPYSGTGYGYGSYYGGYSYPTAIVTAIRTMGGMSAIALHAGW
jgi:hypothetical protein